MPLSRDVAVRMLVSGRASLLGYINSIVRNWDLADDVFQEVSILAVEKCASISDERHFAGWLRQAARFEALNLLRKSGRSPQLLGDAVLDLLDTAWDAAEKADSCNNLDALRACIEKLTAESRHVLELRYAEGIKGTELARLLEQPPNTVYVRLSRLHRKLADCVAQQIADREDRQ
jgi:RNA polymerase sigma-70 factor, ECF subfamily